MDDVFLYSIDDLAEMVREGLDARESAVVQAEAIIESQVDSFLHWMRARDRVPLIHQSNDGGVLLMPSLNIGALFNQSRPIDQKSKTSFPPRPERESRKTQRELCAIGSHVSRRKHTLTSITLSSEPLASATAGQQRDFRM